MNRILITILMASGFGLLHAQGTGGINGSGAGVAQRIIRGNGVPSSALCSNAGNVGKVYLNQTAAAPNSSLYTCDNTGVGTYAWELSGGSPSTVCPGSSSGTADAAVVDTGAGACTDSTVIISAGAVNAPGAVAAGVGGSTPGQISIQANSGSAAAVPASSWGFGPMPSAMTTSVMLQPPNAVPATNTVMLIGATTANVAPFTYVGISGSGTFCMTSGCSINLSSATGFPKDYGASFGFPANGTALTTGQTMYFRVQNTCTFYAWDILVDAGTATVKFWKIASGTAIPTVSNSISTSGVAISTGTAVRSTTLSDFTTTTFTAGDIGAVNITAVSGADWLSAFVECQ